MQNLSDDEVGHILKKVTNGEDRKSCAKVCTQWRRVESSTREMLRVLIPQLLHSFLPRYKNLLTLEARNGICDLDLELISDTCRALQVLNLNLWQTVSYGDVFQDSHVDTVTDQGICSIAAKCMDLREVYLRRRNGLGNAGLTALMKSCPNIVHLDLGFCHRITDQALEAIGAAGYLEVLILHGCTLITDRGLASLAAGSTARSLKRLELCQCDRITDLGVSLLQQLSYLKVLNLAECGPRITDAGCVALKGISTLESINLSWLSNISDVSLLAIVRHCQNLKEINITGCESVTGDGVRSFSQHTSLQAIILNACYNIHIEDIEQTVLECPTLGHLGLDRELRHWIPARMLERIEGRCQIEWVFETYWIEDRVSCMLSLGI